MAYHLPFNQNAYLSPSMTRLTPFCDSSWPNSRTQNSNSWKFVKPISAALSRSSCETPFSSSEKIGSLDSVRSCREAGIARKPRVFFLDVNPLCYEGSSRSLQSFARWISLFFSQVSLGDPVIAVFDGEGGNEYRRRLLPSYKAKRRRIYSNNFGRSHQIVLDVLQRCNVPVVKSKGHEADDVIATLTDQVLSQGYRAVIASPDKDFKQLISEDVQIVMPMPQLQRWSFYTLKHYRAQYNCEPQSDLSLRCILGDEIDGVPGVQHLAPGFGRKTALKLLNKHGSLENLLSAASVRTVGRQYAQDVLTKYADFLRRNYEVLSLKRDVNVKIEEHWLSRRDQENDSTVLSNLMRDIKGKS